MERQLIKVDKNGTKYWLSTQCPKCGGTGRIPHFGHVEGGVCFKCNGTGRFDTVAKEYTPEYAAKLAERRERKAEKERQALLDAFDRDTTLAKMGFANGRTYVVCGDTFQIKDQLKEAGAKYHRELGWHFAEPNDEYECVEVLADEVLEITWNFRKPCFSFVEGAKEIVKAKMTNDELQSEYVGEVGKRITVELRLKRVFSYDVCIGYQQSVIYVNIFEDQQGNVMVWKTSSWHGAEHEIYEVTGTIKEHTEYKGVRQTVFTRCKVRAA